MNHSGPILQRFLFALGGVAAVGLVFYHRVLIERRVELAELIGMGILLAGLLAFVRHGWARTAMVLAGAVVPLRMALAPGEAAVASPEGVSRMTSWISFPVLGSREWITDLIGGMALGYGAFAIALMFHIASESGWRIGKFFLVGPLLGLLCLALVPLEQLAEVLHLDDDVLERGIDREHQRPASAKPHITNPSQQYDLSNQGAAR